MGIFSNLCKNGTPSKENIASQMTQLSHEVSKAYNPVTNADVPFIAAVLKFQLSNFENMMDGDPKAMGCYESLCTLFSTMAVRIPLRKDDNGGAHNV